MTKIGHHNTYIAGYQPPESKLQQTDRKLEAVTVGTIAGTTVRYAILLPCYLVKNALSMDPVDKVFLSHVKDGAERMLDDNNLRGTKIVFNNPKQKLEYHNDAEKILSFYSKKDVFEGKVINIYKFLHLKLPSPLKKICNYFVDDEINAPRFLKRFKQVQAHSAYPMEIFNEIGRGVNRVGAMGKVFKSFRYAVPFAASILGVMALFTKNVTNPYNQDQSISQSIKNNLGKLVFAAFLPLMADETVASVRAYKFVKKFDPKLLPKMKANIALRVVMGLSSAIAAGAAARLAVIAKDRVIKEETPQ